MGPWRIKKIKKNRVEQSKENEEINNDKDE